MKIYINREPVIGPWGGGNRFLTAFVNVLRERGHTVVHRLQPNIDLLFCMDPRPSPWGDNFIDLIEYRQRYQIPLHARVGDVGTHGKPIMIDIFKAFLPYVDKVIFPSNWAKEYAGNILYHIAKLDWHVIANAPLIDFYKNRRNTNLNHDGKIRLVTHHWSDNELKGFETYKFIDSLPNVKFTYIGRKPTNITLSSYKGSMLVSELCEEIPKHDIYVSASKLEAGANHVLEGLACGLPMLYTSDGGSIVEYCEKYGCSFSENDQIPDAIEKIVNSYEFLQQNIQSYNRTINDVVFDYIRLLSL